MNLFDLSAVLTLDSSQYERGINSARSSATGFTKSMNGMKGTLAKAQQGFTVFKGVLSNLVSNGINLVANSITSNLGGAISRLDTLKNYEIVMGNLGHDSDVAKAQINKLSDAVNGLPTTLPAIVSMQQQFAALGGEMEDATDLTIALNNATLAGGQGQEKANSAMQQWYQMIAAGKPDLMSMRIINEAMPAQLDAIAKSVLGQKATWQDLNQEWQKNPEITQKVKDAILDLNENGYEVAGKKVQSFKEQAIDANKGIQTSLTNIKTQIQNGLSNLIDNALGYENVAETMEQFKEAIKNGFKGINDFVDNVQEFGFVEAVRLELEKLPDIIDQGLSAMDELPALVETAMDKARTAFTTWTSTINYAELVGSIIQGISENLPKVIESIATFFNDTVAPWIAENGADIVVSLGKGMITALPTIISAMGQIVNGILKVVVGLPVLLLAKGLGAVGKFALGILKGANKVATAAGKLVSAAVKGLGSLASKVAGAAAKAISSFVGKIAGGVGKAKSAALKLVNGVVNTVKSGLSKVGDVGMNLVRGIWNGISSGYGWITGRIRSWVGNVKSFLKNLFGIASPSKWARDEIGKMIDAGLALGISNNADMVDDAFEDVMPEMDRSMLSSVNNKSSSKIVSPVINLNTVVNGAEDPEQWADKLIDRMQLEARMA